MQAEEKSAVDAVPLSAANASTEPCWEEQVLALEVLTYLCRDHPFLGASGDASLLQDITLVNAAIEEISSTLECHDATPLDYFFRAVFRLCLREWQPAIFDFALASNDYVLGCCIGDLEARYGMHQWDQALELVNVVLKSLDREEIHLRSLMLARRGLILAHSEEWARSDADFEEAIRMCDTSGSCVPILWTLRGAARERRGCLMDARRDYTRAAEALDASGETQFRFCYQVHSYRLLPDTMPSPLTPTHADLLQRLYGCLAHMRQPYGTPPANAIDDGDDAIPLRVDDADDRDGVDDGAPRVDPLHAAVTPESGAGASPAPKVIPSNVSYAMRSQVALLHHCLGRICVLRLRHAEAWDHFTAALVWATDHCSWFALHVSRALAAAEFNVTLIRHDMGFISAVPSLQLPNLVSAGMLHPRHPEDDFQVLTAKASMRHKRWLEAHAALQTLLQRRPKQWCLLKDRGLCAFHAGNHADALRDLTTYLECLPEGVAPVSHTYAFHGIVAMCLLSLKQWKELRSFYDRHRHVYEHHLDMDRCAAQALLVLGEPRTACCILRAARADASPSDRRELDNMLALAQAQQDALLLSLQQEVTPRGSSTRGGGSSSSGSSTPTHGHKSRKKGKRRTGGRQGSGGSQGSRSSPSASPSPVVSPTLQSASPVATSPSAMSPQSVSLADRADREVVALPTTMVTTTTQREGNDGNGLNGDVDTTTIVDGSGGEGEQLGDNHVHTTKQDFEADRVEDEADVGGDVDGDVDGDDAVTEDDEPEAASAEALVSVTQQHDPVHGLDLKRDEHGDGEGSASGSDDGDDGDDVDDVVVDTVVRSGSNDSPTVVGVEGIAKSVGKLSWVTSDVIGRGSGGSVVYRGLFEGSITCAIKVLQKVHWPVAQQEIDNLLHICMERDDLPSSIVRYYGKEEDEERVYIALTLCDCTLTQWIASDQLRTGPDSSAKQLNKAEKMITSLMVQICEAVRWLHRVRIVHNDINPRNVLLWKNRAKLADMGLSKRLDAGTSSFSYSVAAPNGDGMPGWYAFEVLTEGRKTGKVDVFALGCLLYYMWTRGQHPFGDRWFRNGNICARLPPSLHPLTPLQCDLVHRMLSHTPEDRPAMEHVCVHPVFWRPHVCLTFMHELSNAVDFRGRRYRRSFEAKLRAILGHLRGEHRSLAEAHEGASMSPHHRHQQLAAQQRHREAQAAAAAAAAASPYGAASTPCPSDDDNKDEGRDSGVVGSAESGDWTLRLHGVLLEHLTAKSAYKGNLLVDLVRAIRNLHEHWGHIAAFAPKVGALFNATRSNIWRYFHHRFPLLLLMCWRAATDEGLLKHMDAVPHVVV